MTHPLFKKIEAILFYESEGIHVSDIARILKIPKEEIVPIMKELADLYKIENKDIVLLSHNDTYQFVVSGETRSLLLDEEKREKEGELSRASLETLSIIVYLGSASKSQIDYIRGVQSNYTLRILLSRGLIARSHRAGRDTFYTVTLETLRFMGIERREDMPNFDTIYQELSKTASLAKNTEE